MNVIVEFDDYERENLLRLLRKIGYPCNTKDYDSRTMGLDLNTGDWVGQIYQKLGGVMEFDEVTKRWK